MNILSDFRQKTEASDDSRIIRLARTAVLEILSFLGAALLASVNVSQVFSPFGIAFATAVDGKYLISSCFGAAAGYILTQDSLSALRYICALLCSAVLVSLLRQFKKSSGFKLTVPLTAFGSLLLTGATVLFAGDTTPTDFAVIFGEACIGFAAAYIFTQSLGALSVFSAHGGFRQNELQGLAVCLLLLLVSLKDITLFSFSFSRALAVLLLLIMSLVSAESGLTVAVAAGLIFYCDEAVATASFICTAAGLAVAVAGNRGKLIKSAVFFGSYAVLYAFAVASADKLYLLTEAFVGCAAFAAVPESVYKRFKAFLLTVNEPDRTQSQRQTVLTRLDSAAAAVAQVTDCVGAASELLKAEYTDTELELYTRVRDEICAGCSHYSICWTRNFSDCKRAFDTMNETLKNNEKLNSENLPRYLNGCCPRKSELAQCFTHRYLEHTVSENMQRQVNSLRELTAKQLGGLHAMLSETSAQLSVPVRSDSDTADRIYLMLREEFSVKAKSVACTYSEQSRLKIEIRLRQKPERLSEKQLCAALEEICGVYLSHPVVNELDGEISVVVYERTRYRVEAAASRACADSESLCGDSYEGFYDSEGNYCAVLSDGMGTGLRAAIDSSLTVTMAARLIKAGFSCDSALKLVNCAMLLRSSKESLSTADIVKIDLYSGRATFCKAGACRSLVKHRSKITEVNCASMPLGILNETDTAEQSLQLKSGDLLLLCSDGAYEYCDDEVRDAFAVSLDESVSEITQRTLLAAKNKRKACKSDDITVIAIRLRENKA